MRSFFPVSVLACLLTAPAALAAGPGHPPSEPERALITAPLSNDPLDGAEARGKGPRPRAWRRAWPPGLHPAPSAPEVSVPPHLEAIAACESGSDPQAVSATGAYRGKYQFSPATWQAVGGSGDPAAAPESEQDQRAATLYARSGAGQWPVCGS